MTKKVLVSGLVLVMAISASAADDLLVADFEAENYGDWKVEGEAFGTAPAKGTLGGQMHVLCEHRDENRPVIGPVHNAACAASTWTRTSRTSRSMRFSKRWVSCGIRNKENKP